MFLIDMEQGRIIDDKELKDSLANAKPYREWIEKIRIKLDEVPPPTNSVAAQASLRSPAGLRLHPGRHQVHPRADGQNGEEATGSMGTDSALPCCRPRTRRCTTTSSSCSPR
jgi:glutamate synthase (NADPH/NADH) large chain